MTHGVPYLSYSRHVNQHMTETGWIDVSIHLAVERCCIPRFLFLRLSQASGINATFY